MRPPGYLMGSLRRIAGLMLLVGLVASMSGCGDGFADAAEAAVFEAVPVQVQAGGTLTLRGQALGETQNGGWVSVGGEAAAIRAWATDQIIVEVPAVGPGEVLVVVSWSDKSTAPVSITVLP